MPNAMTDNAIIQEILIVDDIPANLVALRRILRDLNIKIIEAASGNEALQLMLEHDFSMVLLDVQMPIMTGYEVAEIMRSNKNTRNVPIIFITANATTEENAIKGYDVGAMDYIIKPINKSILRSKVCVLLELHKQKKQLELSKNSLSLTNSKEKRLNSTKNIFLCDLNTVINQPMEEMSQIIDSLFHSPINEDQRSLIEKLSSTQQNLEDILQNILDVTKIQNGNANVKKQPFELDFTVHEAIETAKKYAEKSNKNIELACDFSGLGEIYGDSEKILKILESMLKGMIHYSPRQKIGFKGYIIEESTEQVVVKFSVSDNSTKTPNDIYRHFIKQTDKSDSLDIERMAANGLSIAVSLTLVEMMNGVVGIHDESGKPTSLWFTLPLKKVFSPNQTIAQANSE